HCRPSLHFPGCSALLPAPARCRFAARKPPHPAPPRQTRLRTPICSAPTPPPARTAAVPLSSSCAFLLPIPICPAPCRVISRPGEEAFLAFIIAYVVVALQPN